jgi:hypothetical protein
MRTPKIISRKNDMRLILGRIEKNVQKRTDKLAAQGAYDFRAHIQRSIGRKGIFGPGNGSRNVWNKVRLGRNTQTGASAASVYFIDSQKSTYDEQRSEFIGRAGNDYAGRSMDEIIFEELDVKSSPGHYRAAFASMSLIIAFWEYGHHNRFTGRYEYMPLMAHTIAGLYNKLAAHYSDILVSKDD